jgi:G6PDH family F420-dependent oxidoreductase
MHPATVAQAAATTAALLPGRFMLGVGTGENLNEHIFGDYWPPGATRRAMLEEAVTLIRRLWQGGLRSHQGQYYTAENAQLYTLPELLPPVADRSKRDALGPYGGPSWGRPNYGGDPRQAGRPIHRRRRCWETALH